MSKDFAFMFYPGDYLRDTQCLSEKTQVAYDRIMCEHMRNICITQKQLNFFTKRLSPDEFAELMFILHETNNGYEIEWVAESIRERIAYNDSRSKNRKGKIKEDMKTYDSHMEGEGEGEDNSIIKSINVPFEKFWNLYDKKRGDKSKLSKKWESFSDEIRLEIMAYLPKYIQSTPDKSFRKDPQTFFNNHSWEDEIIVSAPVRTTPILTYEEILKLSEKNPEIWKQYKSVKRDGERKAVFELIT
jgi:hypothetical protein